MTPSNSCERQQHPTFLARHLPRLARWKQDPKRLLKLGAVLFIGCYFLWFAGSGLWADFSGDDLMNLHGDLQQGPAAVLRANLFYWSGSFRPLGGLAYLLSYALVGFDPFPLRVVCYGLLLVNLWLAFRFASALTGSAETALLATLLITYHAWFVDLYYSSGTIYELLCFFFYFAAFLYYVLIRQRGALLRARQWLWLSLLYICAPNSKEMAVTFPLFLGLYEVLYHSPALRLSDMSRWFREDGRGMLVTGLLTVPYLVGKLTGGILIENPLYQPVISPGRFLDAFHLYLNPLFYQDHFFRDSNTVQLLLAMLALAAWRRSRALLFAWFFLLLSVLPFIFLPHYAAFFLYIPSVGWALDVAITLMLLREWLLRTVSRIRATQTREPTEQVSPSVSVATFLLLAVGLALAHRAETPKTLEHFFSIQPDVRGMARELKIAQPEIPPGSRILFVNDPFPADYSLLFLVRLLYHDLSLEVGRAKPGAVPPADSQPYNLKFDYQGSRLLRITE